MSNRRSQFAPDYPVDKDYTAISRRAELRVIQNTISGLPLDVLVVGIILAVAIIPARLADWMA
jgi:hypothetical protein